MTNILIKKEVRLCYTVGSKNEYVDLKKDEIISAEELPASSRASFSSFADITTKEATVSITQKNTIKLQKQKTTPEKDKASPKGTGDNKDKPKDKDKAKDKKKPTPNKKGNAPPPATPPAEKEEDKDKVTNTATKTATNTTKNKKPDTPPTNK